MIGNGKKLFPGRLPVFLFIVLLGLTMKRMDLVLYKLPFIFIEEF